MDKALLRIRSILFYDRVSAVEFWQGFGGLVSAIWLLILGGDSSFRYFIGALSEHLPFLRSGRLLISLFLGFALLRLYAVAISSLRLRVFASWFFSLFWLFTLIASLVVGNYSNELPVYAVNCLVNCWIQYRLVGRLALQRKSRSDPGATHPGNVAPSDSL
jgi:hypothetical protein